MFPLFNRQNTPAPGVNNNPTVNHQRESFFNRILNALSPCSAHRAVLNSVVNTPPNMRTPAGTAHVNGVVANNDALSEKALKRELRAWVNSAERDEKAQRKTAANKIRECINQSSDTLYLSNLGLSSLPEHILKNIPSLSSLNISMNNLGAINLSGFQSLTHLDCSGNFSVKDGEKTLDISNCPHLFSLRAGATTFTNINVNGCHQLHVLDCWGSRGLNTLDLTDITNLATFNAMHSGLIRVTWPVPPKDKVDTLKKQIAERVAYINRNRGVPNVVAVFQRMVDGYKRDLAKVERGNLSELYLRGTHINFNQLPIAVRNNQNIQIDIRPTAENILLNFNTVGNNGGENTHKASVEASVSATAKKLKDDFSGTNKNRAYHAFSQWVQSLSTEDAAIVDNYANESFKNQAAKEWIQNPMHLDYKDKQSNVTLKEFLALAWTAIQNAGQRESDVSLNDARASLRDALYEIRRGYNLNEDHKPKDDGEVASNICAGGSFNKIAEKLVSVVRGASVTMITPQTFGLSLENTIRQAAMNAVDDDPKLAESLADNNGILTEDIWNVIEASVKSAVRAEFKAEPHIDGKPIELLLNEHTNFIGVLEYFEVIPDNKSI